MASTIVTPDQDSIVGEIDIAAPPERVFKALTDAGELTGNGDAQSGLT